MVIRLQLLLAAFLCTIFSIQLTAQNAIENLNPPASEYPYWIEWMQDESVNFYDVQTAFEAYWEDREVTKGSGWKPFKRWEWWTERHIYPDGTRHDADKAYKAYKEYMAKYPSAKESNGDWINLGPLMTPSKGYEGLGRINAVAFHPTDPDILYIGAPAGGCWRYDGPGTWFSTTDDLPTLGVSSIVVDWSNPDRVFIGTGDRDAGDAQGMGVFKSEDAGETWVQWNNGMGNTTVGRMIQHPDDAGTIYAASSSGIWKTTDFGANWTQIKTGGFKEIVFKPGDPSTLYIGGGSYTQRSMDDGQTWEVMNNGVPNGSRTVIGVTDDDPEYIYIVTSSGSEYGGTYRSTNGGDSFTEMSTTPNIMSWGCNGGSGGQAWYDLDIAVDPNNKDVIYVGGVNCFKSEDGGVSWDINSHWWGDCNVPAVHADLHVLEYNPLNDRLYAGNDGGIYYTDNGGTTWPEITDGLPISQVYRIGQCAIDIDKVVNGYQDNGSSTYYGDPNNWQTTGGGDGMECAFDHTNSAYSYSTIYYGDIYRHYNNGQTHQVAGQGAHGMTEEGGWITPFTLHEGNSNIMYVGMKNIWRAEGVKTNNFTWKKITDEGGDNIDVTEHSPADYNLFYYARNAQLYRSDNVNDEEPEWINLSTYIPGAGNVFDVECHPHNADVVYATKGSSVYVSSNRGFTWTDITGSLPDINMNSLAAYINSVDGIYVGSDAGVWYRDASMDDWVMFSDGLPVDASINEIEIYHNPENPEEDVIRAGTYGRGMWSSPVWHGQPEAGFYAEETTLPVGCEVDFVDQSLGVPTSWEWTFEGGTPETSTEKNPEGIVYGEEGVYDVTLTVTNSEGTDTYTWTDYMNISTGVVPNVFFTANDSIVCSGSVITFQDESSNCPTGWQWSFEPNTVVFVNGTNQFDESPQVAFAESGAYNVTLTVTNNAGSNVLTKEDYINIGGIGLPFNDDFESGSLDSRSWTVQNPDFNITWEVATVGGIEPGDQAAYMNFFDYLVPPGGRDRLITPVLNMDGFDQALLSFRHAYAKQHASVTDSLIVKISVDCGESWTRIFEGGEDGDGSFATHELMSSPFVPEVPEDWCGLGWGAGCTVLDISQWTGFENVQIMFETYNFFGNNLYIDNVMIGPTTDVLENSRTGEVAVFPNPTSGELNIVLPEASQNAVVVIYNSQGQELIRMEDNNTGLLKADLSAYGTGIYFLRVEGNGSSTVKKVVLER